MKRNITPLFPVVIATALFSIGVLIITAPSVVFAGGGGRRAPAPTPTPRQQARTYNYSPRRASARGVWHASSWVRSRTVISARKIADNLNYLYSNAPNISNISGITFGAPSFGNSVGHLNSNVNRTILCPQNYVLTGLRVSGSYSGGWVGRWIVSGIQPICQPVHGSTISATANIRVPWSNPNNWARTGGVIPARDLSNDLQYLYTLYNNLYNNAGKIIFGGRTYRSAIGKINQGVTRNLTCPANTVVTSIYASGGYSGGFLWFRVDRWIVSGLRLTCSHIGGGPAASSIVRWYAPSSWVGTRRSISSQKMYNVLRYLHTRYNQLTQNNNGIIFRSAGNTASIGDLYANVRSTLYCPRGTVASGLYVSGGYSGGIVGRWIVSGLKPVCTPIGKKGTQFPPMRYHWVSNGWGGCNTYGAPRSACGSWVRGVSTLTYSCKDSLDNPAPSWRCPGMPANQSRSCSAWVEGTYPRWYCYRCFTAGTKVTMADGSKKDIEKVAIGEKLRGKDGVINTVLGFERPKLGGRKLYSINGGPYFITPAHPLRTTKGWKSINTEETMRENSELVKELHVKTLQVGDILVKENGTTEEVKSIKGSVGSPDTQLYNFVLSGDRTYYVNGILTHNEFSQNE